jgi:hypothetical protein
MRIVVDLPAPFGPAIGADHYVAAAADLPDSIGDPTVGHSQDVPRDSDLGLLPRQVHAGLPLQPVRLAVRRRSGNSVNQVSQLLRRAQWQASINEHGHRYSVLPRRADCDQDRRVRRSPGRGGTTSLTVPADLPIELWPSL